MPAWGCFVSWDCLGTMSVDIIHLPNFRIGASGSQRKEEIRSILCDVRKEVGCSHISHAAHTRFDEKTAAKPRDLSVVMTLPTKWLFHHVERNYFRFETIQRYSAPLLQPQLAGTMRELTPDTEQDADVREFIRDGIKEGLGNLYLNVTATNVHGLLGSSLFMFQVAEPDKKDFKEQMRAPLIKMAHLVHNSLFGNHYPTPANNINPLTKREVDCLRWAAYGKTDGEIADILQIARWTVVTYLQNARVKLGCTNRTATVATALSLGIFDLSISNGLISRSEV